MKLDNKKGKEKNKTQKISIVIHNCLIAILTITLVVLAVLVGTKEYQIYKISREAENVVKSFENLREVSGPEVTYNTTEVKIGKYRVIGSIKIDAINIDYPILEKTTEESMMLSITKLYGPALNEYGNVSLAGHNAHNGTLFSRLSNLNVGDVIELTDSDNKMLKYEVYNIYSVLPSNLDPVKTTDENVRELTLISCINSARKRIIIKAREV